MVNCRKRWMMVLSEILPFYLALEPSPRRGVVHLQGRSSHPYHPGKKPLPDMPRVFQVVLAPIKLTTNIHHLLSQIQHQQNAPMKLLAHQQPLQIGTVLSRCYSWDDSAFRNFFTLLPYSLSGLESLFRDETLSNIQAHAQACPHAVRLNLLKPSQTWSPKLFIPLVPLFTYA